MKKFSTAAIMLGLALAPPCAAAGSSLFKTAASTGDDPAETGKRAAIELKAAFAEANLKAVIVMDSFEDIENKKAMLGGVASVLPKEILFGGTSYGGFTQAGSIDYDGVFLLGIGGDVNVATALVEKMGTAGLTMENDLDALTTAFARAGESLAKRLPELDQANLLVLISDAHSPKNQLLLDGVQKIAGKTLPITGGSVCKNPGQNWVYFQGKPYTDSAIGLLLSGPFQVSQAGRQAKTNDAVIKTASEGSASVLKTAPGKPIALMAFNCGGRMGKLDRLEDELGAIQKSVGKALPVFGTYCAGEYGPADLSDNRGDLTPCGRGWHVMFTVLTEAEDLLCKPLGDSWKFFSEEPGSKLADVWRVKDGVLSCKGTPKGGIYLDRDLADFTLQLEWRWPAEEGKGGVLLRTAAPWKIWPKSLEAQINAGSAGDFWGLDGFPLAGPEERLKKLDHPDFGKLTNLQRTDTVEKPTGEWNQYDIVAAGSVVTLKINGKEVNKATNCDAHPGKICLTAEGSRIEFRNIRLIAGGGDGAEKE